MARPEKVQAVADIKEQWESSEAVFLTEFSGLTVAEQQALRRGLKEGGAKYRVVKMSLARRAADELEVSAEVTDLLSGPTALAFAEDPATAAKALDTFAKDHDALVIKGMLMAGDFLSPEQVKELASLDSREVLRSKIAGGLAGPMTKFAGLMSAFTRNAASMFGQLLERKEEEAPPPEPEAATDPEPATEDDGAEEGPTKDDAAAEEAVADDGATDAEPAPEAAAAPETERDGESTENSAPEAEATAEVADQPDDQPADESADEEDDNG
jgi:large subunit ribosomal protein L10